jgi:hypothetical protein
MRSMTVRGGVEFCGKRSRARAKRGPFGGMVIAVFCKYAGTWRQARFSLAQARKYAEGILQMCDEADPTRRRNGQFRRE